jgi:hypothetical protein
MRDKFAKLYEKEDGEQILVVISTDNEGKPCVQFSFVPKGLGVCTAGPSWNDDDKGWDKAESFFESVTEEKATEFIAGILKDVFPSEFHG